MPFLSPAPALSSQRRDVKLALCVADSRLKIGACDAITGQRERTIAELLQEVDMIKNAKYQIGQVVKHRIYPFRGIVFDVDPVFDNTDEWYDAIPSEVRPSKDQPYYHLFAENEDTEYIAYVSEQNLLIDDTQVPLRHPQIDDVFYRDLNGAYVIRGGFTH